MGIAVLGIVVRFVTYSLASGGGTYIVAWGAIIFGGIRAVQGLFQYMSGSGEQTLIQRIAAERFRRTTDAQALSRWQAAASNLAASAVMR